MKTKLYHSISILMLLALSLDAFAINHPSLLFTAKRIEQAKARVQRDTVYANGWDEILQTAKKAVGGTDYRKLETLSLVYLMTDDKQLKEEIGTTIKNTLTETIANGPWSSSEMLARKPQWRSDLGQASRCYNCAVGYDAIYATLSAKERKEIAAGLYREGVEPALGDWALEPTRVHSLNSMGHNWWTSCVCMGGILALSIENEVPEAKVGARRVEQILPEWFEFAGDVLQQKSKSFDDNGGMYESVNYASFGIQEAQMFQLAWENCYPNDADTKSARALILPYMAKLPSYFISVCYPTTTMLESLNFGDSHENIVGDAPLILGQALLEQTGNSAQWDKANALWYLSKVKTGQHRDGMFVNRPLGLLYMPDLSQAPRQSTIPTAQLYSDFGWATMRTSFADNATMLAIKSGMTWNHAHADAGSFMIFHKGIDILKDGGHCWYPNENYRKYFFQSQAHNTVLWNGKGQPTYQQYHGSLLRGNLHYLLAQGDTRYVLANATGPNSDHFDRFFRHIFWKDNVVFCIDDLHSHEAGEYQWLWHPNGEVKKSGYYINVTNGESAMSICPLYPRLLANSDFVHDYPDDLYWETHECPTEDLKGTDTYWSLHLPGKFDRIKGVTAFTLKDTPDQKELPKFERREGKDWIGIRMTYKGKVTDIYINQLADGRLMHSNSWIEADGWQTDAYMFAVSYEEGSDPARTDDIFIAYCSALRRGSESYFGSQSKLFGILKGKDILLEGQPKIHAWVRGKEIRKTAR